MIPFILLNQDDSKVSSVVNLDIFFVFVHFFTEALEALLNRIQVDIEVDSNLKSLSKGNHLIDRYH